MLKNIDINWTIILLIFFSALTLNCGKTKVSSSSGTGNVGATIYEDYVTVYSVSAVLNSIYDRLVAGISEGKISVAGECADGGKAKVSGDFSLNTEKVQTRNFVYELTDCHKKDEKYDLGLNGTITETGTHQTEGPVSFVIKGIKVKVVGKISQASAAKDIADECDIDIKRERTKTKKSSAFSGKYCDRAFTYGGGANAP